MNHPVRGKETSTHTCHGNTLNVHLPEKCRPGHEVKEHHDK